jgi:hypothetical protein
LACDYLSSSYDKRTTESPDSGFVITGDFNPKCNRFDCKTLSSQCNLKQIVQSPTRNDAILDLIFTNIKYLNDNPITSALLGTSDHACIKWRTKDKDQGIKPIKRKVKVRPVIIFYSNTGPKS